MSVANIRETQIALSFRKQSALHTKAPTGTSNYFSLSKTNPALAALDLATETDAADIGKGNEFANNVYPTNWDARIPFEKYSSSEIAAFLAVYGLGSSSKTPVGAGFKYTCTPLDPVADGIELPSFTYAEAVRQGGSALFDRASVGNVIQSFGLTLSSGPGRQNSKMNAEFVGSGWIEQPSGIVIPASTTEHFLRAGSALITILGNNYITLKRLVNLELVWNNAIRLDQGFYPGGGSNDGADVRGRLENGDRELTCRFQVRMESTSSELTDLLAQTEGTATIELVGAAGSGFTHGVKWTLHRVRIKAASIGDDSGLITIQCELTPLYDSSDGILTIEATTGIDTIGEAAA